MHITRVLLFISTIAVYKHIYALFYNNYFTHYQKAANWEFIEGKLLIVNSEYVFPQVWPLLLSQ